jgi:hypothetical protein
MQNLVGAERKNYDREKPQEYCGRASQQAAGMRIRFCHLNCHLISTARAELDLSLAGPTAIARSVGVVTFNVPVFFIG